MQGQGLSGERLSHGTMASDGEFGPFTNRARVAWWVFVLALGLVAAYLAYSFIGVIVLGVFGYYATRPICRRFARYTDSPGLAAVTTVVVVVVPILLLVVYTGFRIYQQVRRLLFSDSSESIATYLNVSALPADQQAMVSSLLRNPAQLVSQPRQVLDLLPTLLQQGTLVFNAVFGGLLLVALAVALSYYLLENDHRLARGFESLVGGEDTVAYAYASTVDADLESVFFGNVLFVAAMTVIAGVTYEATTLLAPAGIEVPLILALSVLTGLTSLLPIVVSKVVYLPLVGYLALQALDAGRGALAFVVGVLVVYFLVLDILPQTFVQPYITGRQLDMVLLMFSYILGPTLLGWYGFFVLPIVFIVMLEAVRIVLPELVRGEPLTPTISLGHGVGSDVESTRVGVSATDDPIDEAGEDETATEN